MSETTPTLESSAETVAGKTPKPRQPINMRKALAGLRFLNGEGSMYRCLRAAGYSRWVARDQMRQGLTAKACVEEAYKLNKKATPANLLQLARGRAYAVIENADPLKIELRDAVRMVESFEKVYGSRELPPSQVETTLVDRLTSIVAYLVVAQQRGLPVPKLDQLLPATLDVAVSHVAPAITQRNSNATCEKVEATPSLESDK